MSNIDVAAAKAWMERLPEPARTYALLFPVGSHLHFHNRVYYPIGYSEEDHIYVSVINPAEDYNACYATRVAIPVEFAKTMHVHIPEEYNVSQ